MTCALTIAGSDSGGGAGLQADLKTFAAHGVFGLTAVTAVTAQNSIEVAAIHAVPAEIVARQIEVVVSDFGVGAAKTGMLLNAEIIETVAANIAALKVPNLLVDPVMIATSGDRLLSDDAVETLKTHLISLASVVTPNRPEAEILTGRAITSLSDARDAARRMHDLGPAAVIIKGGHLPGPEVVDLLFDGHNLTEFRAPRVETDHSHGTGCTFGAAITAELALGHPLADATHRAKTYVEQCLRHPLPIGQGRGPLNHFWRE